MEEWYLLLAAAGVSGLLTGLLRRYALARSLLDTPNSRSSHVVPTPRGGGVAIVVTFVSCCLFGLYWEISHGPCPGLYFSLAAGLPLLDSWMITVISPHAGVCWDILVQPWSHCTFEWHTTISDCWCQLGPGVVRRTSLCFLSRVVAESL